MNTKWTNSLSAVLIAGFVLMFGYTSGANAKSAHRLIKKGNKHLNQSFNPEAQGSVGMVPGDSTAAQQGKYNQGELDEALKYYRMAQDSRDSLRPELLYNLGGVFSRKGDLSRAEAEFQALPNETPPELRSKAAFNLGNAFVDAQQFDKAVPAYIEALRNNPADMDAKINLELAKRLLQQQQQQQQQQENKDDQKQDKKQQQQKQQNEKQQQEKKKEEQQKQQQQQQQQEMDKKRAERMLNKMKQDEKELLKKVVQQQVPKPKKRPKKDW